MTSARFTTAVCCAAVAMVWRSTAPRWCSTMIHQMRWTAWNLAVTLSRRQRHSHFLVHWYYTVVNINSWVIINHFKILTRSEVNGASRLLLRPPNDPRCLLPGSFTMGGVKRELVGYSCLSNCPISNLKIVECPLGEASEHCQLKYTMGVRR